MTIWVLGGGPAGLALVDGLGEVPSDRFVLIERDNVLGGLARTIDWEGRGRHDLGPHKIFSLDEALVARVRSLLPEEQWLTRPKISSIFMRGHFLPYPPSPLSLARVYGPYEFTRMVADYFKAKFTPARSEPTTFEEDLRGRVGNRLFELLFDPIARKLWDDPSKLDVKLSKGRVQTPPLIEVVKHAFGFKKRSSRFEALEFAYPKGGLQSLWNTIQNRAAPRGEFRLGLEVTKLRCEGNRVKEIVLRSRKTLAEEVILVGSNDFMFSTLPLDLTIRLLDPPLADPLLQAARNVLQLNDLLLVFLHVEQSDFLRESWIFVPDSAIPFHRVSEQQTFDPEMALTGSIVCCEIMSGPGRDVGTLTDDELVSRSIKGLRAMGYTPKVLASRVIRLPRSYPLFRPGFEPVLTEILACVDCISNLRTIGRQGAFIYIGTLDAMDIGYGAAGWYVRCGNADAASGTAGVATWTEERQRTGHYPVLD